MALRYIHSSSVSLHTSSNASWHVAQQVFSIGAGTIFATNSAIGSLAADTVFLIKSSLENTDEMLCTFLTPSAAFPAFQSSSCGNQPRDTVLRVRRLRSRFC